jgi:hypothetical protein
MKSLFLALAVLFALPAFADYDRDRPDYNHRPDYRRIFECVARNNYGERFQARSMDRFRAERDAMLSCKYTARHGNRSCRLIGCFRR